MTESVLDTRQDTADYDDPPPMRRGMPVTIVEDDTAPDLAVIGSFRTIALLGGEAPFRLLAQDRRRKKATVLIRNNPAGAPATVFPIPQQVITVNGQATPTWDTSSLGDDVTGMEVILNVTGVGGTTPSLTLMMQTSNDGANWGNTVASPAITANGVQRWTAPAPLDRYFRLFSFNMSGTAPTFTIQGTMSATTNTQIPEIPQSVLIGRPNQVSNNQGVQLYDGQVFTYEAESEVWAIPQTPSGAVLIGVIEERRTPRD